MVWSPFLERPGNFSGPKSHRKISNLTITELLYSQSFNIKEVLFIQEVSGVYISSSLDTDELKMALRSRKLSGAFEKRDPGEVKTGCGFL